LRPHRVVVDGNRVPDLPMTCAAVVRGDARVAAISAASILAKVHRDRLCAGLHAQWPAYGFDANKGYPTPAHLRALAGHGPCPAHRRSFAPVRAALAAR
jgi:ribonuclease HII